MSTQAVLRSAEDNSALQSSGTTQFPAEAVLLRLDNVPATLQNRKRIGGRVRELNRILEESGTPFRLRLL